jgi:hypothetical protein
MQHMEGSVTPVLYIGRTVLKGYGTANNSHIVHCTLTAGSDDVEVQNIFNMGNNITCSAVCKYRTAATLCTVETWFV